MFLKLCILNAQNLIFFSQAQVNFSFPSLNLLLTASFFLSNSYSEVPHPAQTHGPTPPATKPHLPHVEEEFLPPQS